MRPALRFKERFPMNVVPYFENVLGMSYMVLMQFADADYEQANQPGGKGRRGGKSRRKKKKGNYTS